MQNNSVLFKRLLAILLGAAWTHIVWATDQKQTKKPNTIAVQQATGTAYASRLDAMQFADDLAARRDLNPTWVRAAIGKAHCIASSLLA